MGIKMPPRSGVRGLRLEGLTYVSRRMLFDDGPDFGNLPMKLVNDFMVFDKVRGILGEVQ
jgi:hypothetical protein